MTGEGYLLVFALDDERSFDKVFDSFWEQIIRIQVRFISKTCFIKWPPISTLWLVSSHPPNFQTFRRLYPYFKVIWLRLENIRSAFMGYRVFRYPSFLPEGSKLPRFYQQNKLTLERNICILWITDSQILLRVVEQINLHPFCLQQLYLYENSFQII